MKSILKFLLAIFCMNTLASADNFVQATTPAAEPKVVVKVPPLTPFDETLQQEMKKYPQSSMFFVDGKTGKVLSVNKAPNVKSSGPNPGKFYPRDEEKLNQPSQIAPYEIREERIDLL